MGLIQDNDILELNFVLSNDTNIPEGLLDTTHTYELFPILSPSHFSFEEMGVMYHPILIEEPKVYRDHV